MSDEQKSKKEREGDQFTVVLEGLRSDFSVFGENLQHVREKGDATFEKVGQLSEDVEVLRDDVGVLKDDVGVLKEDVGVLKEDMGTVKNELRLIRNDLKEKVGRDEFIALEERVIAVEQAVRN